MSVAAASDDATRRARTPRRRVPALRIAVWVVLAFLLALIAYPLAVTVLRTLDDIAAGVAQIATAATTGRLLAVIGNTALVVGAGATIASVIGALLAWLDERTDAALPRFGALMPLAPLLVPPIAGVIGWAVLLDPRVGFLNRWIRVVLGAVGVDLSVGPINIYSLGGLIGMTALYLVPYVFLVVSAALRRLDPALEEASRIGKAGPMRTLVRVTLPAIAPALGAAVLLALISGLGLFSVPIVLGTAARVDVLSVYIFRLFQNYPPQIAPALVLSFGLVALVQALLFVQRLLMPPGRAAAVGGKGTRGARTALGVWRAPAWILSGLYLAAATILPVLGLVLLSLQPFWTPVINWTQMSLANYAFVIAENGPTGRALATSLTLGVVVATVTMLIAALVMVDTGVRSGRRRIADVVTALPATIPHTVVGVAFLIAFSQAPLNLYGTAAILFLAYLIMAVPFGARAAHAAASSIGAELGEASRVFGASESRTFWRILLPIALPGLVAGWVIVFVHTAGEVTASALLAGARNPVIGRALMDLWAFGSFPQVAALALLMTVVNTAMVGLTLSLSRRSFAAMVR